MSIPIDDPALGGETALDLYYRQPQPPLKARDFLLINSAADTVAALLAAGSGLQNPLAPEPVWLNSKPVHARALVWTAVGMINVALHLNSRDALAVLRGYAYSHDTTIDDIARSLTARALPVEALTN